jgi:hypothetical protein
MTCVDLRPRGGDDVVSEVPAPGAPPIGRAAATRAGRWWRWVAAVAVVSPGGAMAYELLTRPDP